MAATVTFVWEPDPMLYAQSVLAVERALADKTAPLVAATEIVQADIRERFETETAPDGTKWQEWAPSYAPIAEKENVGILRKSEELYEAASSTEATVIRGDTVFYNTQTLPHYGLAHQQGQPERDPPLPARPFLGMSNESEAFIFAAFAEWFDRSIDLFVTAAGRVGTRHAIHGAGGLFVSRASVGKMPLPKLG